MNNLGIKTVSVSRRSGGSGRWPHAELRSAALRVLRSSCGEYGDSPAMFRLATRTPYTVEARRRRRCNTGAVEHTVSGAIYVSRASAIVLWRILAGGVI